MLVALVGCRTPTTEQRTATLRAYGLTASLPATDRRAGAVYTGHGLRLDRRVTARSTTRSVTVHGTIGFITSNGDVQHRGSVTAIDRRGYYLTAAHAVGGDPLWVCCGGVFRSARVVFRGDADFDVAVLSVDRPIPDAFEWAHAAGYAAGATVLQSGPSDRTAPSPLQLIGGHPSMQLFAGRVCDVATTSGRDGAYQRVTSSLPSRGGDSGGPVMTPNGALVGVCVAGNPFYFQSYAVRPSPEWARDVIEQDYNAYRSASPTTAPDKGPVFPWN